MRRNGILILMLLLFCFAHLAHATILPEKQTTVTVSHREPNRLLCLSGSVQQVIKADEHPIAVDFSGAEAYLRFQVGVTSVVSETGMVLDEHKEYYRNTVDIYVICNNDEVYNLILQPQQIHSQTITLGSPKQQALIDTLATLHGKDLRERAIWMVSHLEKDEIPPAWEVQAIQREIPLFHELRTYHRRTVSIPGSGLQVREYVIVATQPVTLSEKQFVVPELTTAPFGITLLGITLQAGEQTRLFIVERIREGR